MYKEIVFHLSENLVEEVSDLLMAFGALSVSVEDEWADTEQESPLYGEPGMETETIGWVQSRLIVLIDGPHNPNVLMQECFESLGKDVPTDFVVRNVEPQDWVRLTQSQFEPIEITPQLWIVPTWHDEAIDVTQRDRINIRLDPGLAFGTGSHPTTRLCLKWLVSNRDTVLGSRVLDYGCGSGILAIVAKKLGAEMVIGTDIDTQAVHSALDNAQLNDCEVRFLLPDDCPMDAKYDIVIANILSNPLKLLAPALVSHVRDGGHLVLSGILERQTEELIDAYRGLLDMSVWQTDEGWIALCGKKKIEV